MNTSIVSQLVLKDLRLWRKLITVFFVLGIACIGLMAILYNLMHQRLPTTVLLNLGSTLLITPVGTLGIVLLMQTSVFEKAKSTQQFIMSLPVTNADFILAKLLVNIPVFSVAWLVATGTAFYFTYWLGLLPAGFVPYLTIVFLGIYVAYIYILCAGLLSQSLGMTVIAIALVELMTPAYLWGVVFLAPIRSVIYGSQIVWNSTAITVVAFQILAMIAALSATLMLKCSRPDAV